MAKTLIIGGGAIGLGLAYHLSLRGAKDVVLVERNQLTSGTSWHAAGIVGPLRASAPMTRLASYALELFPRLEDETGFKTGYRRTGGYWLARHPARMDELYRIAALGRHLGLHPQILNASATAAALSLAHCDGVIGALAVPEDASVNPVDLCMAYARAAKSRGVTIRENTSVSRLLVEHGAVKGVALADGRELLADQVALCAGVWSKKLADQAGVSLPLQAVEHMYVVTEPMPGLPAPFPVLRDLDRGIYIKGDAGKLVIGGFEPDAKVWNPFGPEGDRPFLEMAEDWDQFTPFMMAALALIPDLDTAGIQHFMNGPESFTSDSRPLIGETPEVDGLFVAAGMNSVGVMSSAGIGRLLADWMLDGAAPDDAWEVDIARVDPRASASDHVQTRMKEAVSDVFALHWPHKMPQAGRGLRPGPLHGHWAAQGAVFGLTAGWERGLWYAKDTKERDLPYSVGAQPWYDIAQREAAEMERGAVLLDLSPFAKFDISGPDTLAFLQMLAAGNIDQPIGKAIYTPLLNRNGGIEADVTLTRIAYTRFRMVSGAATRWKDMAWLRRHAHGYDLSLRDVTEDEAVIGVMGAAARTLLSGLSGQDLQSFPFGTARIMPVAGIKTLATRVSFVGELGWELSIPAPQAGAVFQALISAGAKPMGHYALDGCRIEKGFRHWGHDLGPGITPLEAGLGFTIDWSKYFTGKTALLQQKAEGLNRRLVLFNLPNHPLVLHDEPIWNNGRVVGLTTSGARGVRTGLTLALGLVNITKGETLSQTCARQFEIEIADRRYQAIALQKPPFDPSGERMRG